MLQDWKWTGAGAFCLDAEGNVLMVLQGAPGEEPKWALPAGGLEPGESLEECCLRETREETGYEVGILRRLFVKRGKFDKNPEVEVHYFRVTVIGGEPSVQDPDGLIHAVGWKAAGEIEELPLSFPEDREWILRFVAQALRAR